MNIIQKSIKTLSQSKIDREIKVIELSQRIYETIGIKISEFPNDFNYPLTNYRIVFTNRCFTTGWVSLLEINPIEIQNQMGYSNTLNCNWIISDGTGTINLPPEKDIEKFFLELQCHLLQN